MTILEAVVRSPWMEYGYAIVIALVTTIGLVKMWVDYLKSNNERLIIKENAATERAKNAGIADVERAKHIADVELEKVRVLAEVEIEKAKQKAIGAAEVVKIWEYTQKINFDMQELKTEIHTVVNEVKEAQAGEIKNRELVKQVFERLQKDMDNVMKAFFDTFKPR